MTERDTKKAQSIQKNSDMLDQQHTDDMLRRRYNMDFNVKGALLSAYAK